MANQYLPHAFFGFLLIAGPVAAQSLRLDPSFQPPVIMNAASSGIVADVVRQPDGKYVIGGTFSSINGVRARNLARLNADGTLDAAFTANCKASKTVLSVALQADGSIVVGGIFDSLANVPRQFIGRVLPNGSVDATFTPVVPLGDTRVDCLAIAPGGDVLSLTASGPRYGVTPTGLRRFSAATGQPVPGFAPAVDAVNMVVQPDGKILTCGAAPAYVLTYMLARLMANGSLDPGFNHLTNGFISSVNQVGYAANGDIYTAGNWSGGQLLRSELTGPQGRLGVGSLDQAYGFALQPNGRILLHGQGTAANPAVTSRILPNGQVDGSYVAVNGPRDGGIRRFLVQPDGAIMMAGSFTLAGTTPVSGLIRMLEANVLAAKDSQVEQATTAWPVPADKTVNVSLETTARPQQIQLLDGLGRVVITQAVAAGAAVLALDVAPLPAGIYTLRVSYAQHDPVLRRMELRR